MKISEELIPAPARSLLVALGVALAVFSTASTATAQDPGDGVQPKLAVVVIPRGTADDDLARDLQEVLIAALSSRGGLRLMGKEEVRDQAGYADLATLEDCLGRVDCVQTLETEQGISALVIARITQSKTSYQFAATVTRPGSDDTHFAFEIPTGDGVDGLLDRLYEFAADIDLGSEHRAAPLSLPPQEDTHDEPPAAEPPPLLGTVGLVGLVSAVSGVVALATGAVFNVIAVSTADALERDIDQAPVRSGGAQGVTRARAKAAEADANDAAALANVFYTTGLVGLGAGVIMLTVDSLTAGEPESQLTVGPWIAPNGSGATIELRF